MLKILNITGYKTSLTYVIFIKMLWYFPGLIKYGITFDISAFIIRDTCTRSVMNKHIRYQEID